MKTPNVAATANSAAAGISDQLPLGVSSSKSSSTATTLSPPVVSSAAGVPLAPAAGSPVAMVATSSNPTFAGLATTNTIPLATTANSNPATLGPNSAPQSITLANTAPTTTGHTALFIIPQHSSPAAIGARNRNNSATTAVTLATSAQSPTIQTTTAHMSNLRPVTLAAHPHSTAASASLGQPSTMGVTRPPSLRPAVPILTSSATTIPTSAGNMKQEPNKYFCCLTLPNGQTILTNTPIQRHPMVGARPTILQQPTFIRGPQGMAMPVMPTSQPMGIGIPTSMAGTHIIHQSNLMTPQAIAPSQMTPEEALAKGTSFFNSLLTKENLKAKRPTLTNLIQELIDGKKTLAGFASALEKELNSGPQTQLVPFLDLLLPLIRQSLSTGSTRLPGIKAPFSAPIAPATPVTPIPGALMTDSNTSISSPSKVQSNDSTAKKKKIPLPPGQKSAWALKKEAREARKRERESLSQGGAKEEKTAEKKDTERTEKSSKPKPERPRKTEKQKKQEKQEKQLDSLSTTLRDDDDVNDVAAMGGVNLAEESQRIMASGAELVGTQIRSCKDEPFLDGKTLTARVARIAKQYNLPEPSKEVVTIISHATQERLKNMVERLGILAAHRSENLRQNPNYEVSNDVKGQMKFLAELDRIEKRRYEEQERELLLRVAKSRSKIEDPEQQKLRQKAKDMQRAEQEEARQREANETALLAIGPRKKPKSSAASVVSSFSQASNLADIKVPNDSRSDSVRRVKRVNMRDLQFLLELDRIHLNRLVKLATL